MPSFLQELEATEQHILKSASKVLYVAGRKGLVGVRYRPPENRDALTPVLAALNAGGALSREEELQLIVDCCDEIVHRPNEQEEPAGYDPPLLFDASDERWEGTVKTARDAVARLFCLDKQPLAAARHASSLVDWFQGMDAEIASRVEGKSEGSEGS